MNGKLLIVEDQTFFRKGLRKMIEDNAIGWTVIGEAENGRDALELIAQDRPDLVLTDIRMPGMDGIELAEQLHRNQPDTDLIILTGYDDFKYAQAALRYGAIDFLLKPCNEETLIDVLRKAYEHYQEKQRQKQRLFAAERAKREGVLRACMLRLPQQSDEAERVLEQCRGCCSLLLVSVDSYFPAAKQYQERDLGLLQFALFNILSELIEGYGLRFQSVPLEFDRYALIVEGEYPDQFKTSAEQNVLDYLAIRITVFPHGLIEATGDLPDAYDRFSRNLNRQDGPKQGSGESGPDGMNNQSKVKELQVQLSADIALGHFDKLKQRFEIDAVRLASLPLEDAKMEALTYSLAMNAAAKQAFDREQADAPLSILMERLQRAGTAEEAAALAKEAMEGFLSAYEDWKSGNSPNVVAMTLEYLDRHYMESCSLSELAKRFHISTAYFSKLFKKETGDNFSVYLTKLRIRKAAVLLLNTEMKVFEIASAVGYDDPNYFTNVFRMLHHVSPSDYRKRHKLGAGQ